MRCTAEPEAERRGWTLLIGHCPRQVVSGAWRGVSCRSQLPVPPEPATSDRLNPSCSSTHTRHVPPLRVKEKRSQCVPHATAQRTSPPMSDGPLHIAHRSSRRPSLTTLRCSSDLLTLGNRLHTPQRAGPRLGHRSRPIIHISLAPRRSQSSFPSPSSQNRTA